MRRLRCSLMRQCYALPVGSVAVLLAGCSQMPLLDPKGPVGDAELTLILIAFALMLIVVVPVTIMALWFPGRYRASARREDYDPNWSHSTLIDLVVWLVPAVIVIALAILAWQQSHRLDPFKPLAAQAKPLTVQVVSLDWKWLFIYPAQQIATVNELVLPAQVPVSFRLTSNSVMTSFFIPRLGSQIYAMAGRQSRLHLLADTPGVYRGQNQQFSGNGFADMHFKVRVVDGKQFSAWVRRAQGAPAHLDAARFKALSRPGIGHPVTTFSHVSPGLFQGIIDGFRSDGVPAADGGG